MSSVRWTLGLLLAMVACTPQGHGGDGSETHWLSACESSSECGPGSCVCGVCTVECKRDSDCPDEIGRCESDPSSELLMPCGKAVPTGLCNLESTAQDAGAATDAGTGDQEGASSATMTHGDSTDSSEDASAGNTDDTADEESTSAPRTDDAPGTTDGGPRAPDLPASMQPSPTSRIRSIVLEAEGLDPLQIGFWDTEQELECAFLPDQEGELRCLPRPIFSVLLEGYSDASCTTRAFSASASRPWEVPLGASLDSPPSVLTFLLDDCSKGRHGVVRVIEEETDLYRLEQDGQCRSIGLRSEYVAVATLDPELFEPATRTQTQLTEAYSASQLIAGERVFDVGLIARDLDAECSPVFNTKAELTECLPGRRYAPYYHADASCSVPLAMITDQCGEGFGMTESSDGSVIYRLGDSYEGPLYRWMGEECNEEVADSSLSEGLHLFHFAEQGVLAPRLTRERQVGPEGLVLEHVADGDARLIPLGYLSEDTGVSCFPSPTASGEVRCLPEIEFIFPDGEHYGYADTECTKPAARCDEYWAHFGPDGFTTLYGPGTEISDSYMVYNFQNVDGVQTCVMDEQLSTGGARTPHCTRGPEIPLDSFPRLTRHVR